MKSEPRLEMCRDGRWLAVTPLESSVGVAVEGVTEVEVRTKFQASYERWQQLIQESRVGREEGVAEPKEG